MFRVALTQRLPGLRGYTRLHRTKDPTQQGRPQHHGGPSDERRGDSRGKHAFTAPLDSTDAQYFWQRLKSALWHSIGQTIDAIAAEQDINATAQFMGALTELVWTLIREYCRMRLLRRITTDQMKKMPLSMWKLSHSMLLIYPLQQTALPDDSFFTDMPAGKSLMYKTSSCSPGETKASTSSSKSLLTNENAATWSALIAYPEIRGPPISC